MIYAIANGAAFHTIDEKAKGIFQAATYIKEAAEEDFLGYATVAFAATSGILLLFGFLTPIASIAAIAWSLKVAWLTLTSVGIYEAGAFLRPGIVSIAIGLLGPGAFSIDAHLFGRRRIIITQGQWSSRRKE